MALLSHSKNDVRGPRLRVSPKAQDFSGNKIKWKKKRKESTVCIMITNFPKGLLWEIQSQREHRDRLTLIMFRSLKCPKSQTWLYIYEAKMHLLFILGRSLNFETLCSRPRQLWNHRKFVPCCSKRFPPFPWTVSTMEQTVHFTTGCCCESVTVSKNTWQGTLLEGEKIISTEVTVGHVCSPDVTTLVCSA